MTSILGGVPASTNLEDDIGGCGSIRVGGCVLDEDEEEEEEIPLIRKNSRSSRSSDIPMQALSGLVSLQGLTMSAIDHALEEIILKTYYRSLLRLKVLSPVQRSLMTSL
jgi:hypothetical protein